MKKLPEKGLRAKSGYFRWFFDDFSGCRHARAKISTVLESTNQAGSNDTHKPNIFENFFFDFIRGPENFQVLWGTL